MEERNKAKPERADTLFKGRAGLRQAQPSLRKNEKHYDVVVVGLGIVGSGALYQAARRGARALGIDRYSPPHPFGSSHGDTRITRLAIGEGNQYMPYIHRSNEIWQELEQATGQTLYLRTGGLIISPPKDAARFHAHEDFVSRTARIATTHNIEHEILDAAETMRRYPLLKMRPQDMAYYEPGSGILRAEACLQAHLDQAMHHGAEIQTNEIVHHYQPNADGVTVTTDKGIYTAEKLILTPGPWLLDLLAPQHRPGVAVYRQTIVWFEAEDIEAFTEMNFPFLIWLADTMEEYFSAFATIREGIQGVKVVTEQYAQTSDPNTVDRIVKAEETAYLYHLTSQRLHRVGNRVVHSDVCMYTVTPDQDFIIDFHPESDRVVLASPCSGHGFKHAAAVGETLAEMALNGRSTLDTSHFSLARLQHYKE